MHCCDSIRCAERLWNCRWLLKPFAHRHPIKPKYGKHVNYRWKWMEMGGTGKPWKTIQKSAVSAYPLPDYQRVLQCIGQTFLATHRVTLCPKISFIVSNYPNNPLNPYSFIVFLCPKFGKTEPWRRFVLRTCRTSLWSLEVPLMTSRTQICDKATRI